jgi:hypothetical protein
MSVNEDLYRQPIVNECYGCDRILMVVHPQTQTSYMACAACLVPESKWRGHKCNLATHLNKEMTSDRKFVDPLKASKQKAKGR